MKVVVTGAAGLLGADLVRRAQARGHEAVGLGRRELDVTDARAVDTVLRVHAPDAVVQCAAFTAVDRAEQEPAVSMSVNRDGAANVAARCRSSGCVVAYVSTDYVFGGDREVPWSPAEPPAPVNHYGRTKLEGERAVADSGAEFLVARVSWLFGDARPSFVDAMVARAERGEPLRVIRDQFSTPTWTRTAADTLLTLLERRARGIFHVTSGGGAASRLDFAAEALRIRGLDVPVEGVPTGTFYEEARRPSYSVLDVGATEDLLGQALPGWRTDLARYLRGEGT